MADTFPGHAGNPAEVRIGLDRLLPVVRAAGTIPDHDHGLALRRRTSDSGLPAHYRGQGALLQFAVADPASLIPNHDCRPFVILVAEPGSLLATLSCDVVKEPRQVCDGVPKLGRNSSASPSAPLP
jgi:hypothetical protein